MKKFLKRAAVITAIAGLTWFFGGAILMGIIPGGATIANIGVPVLWVCAMYKNAMKAINEGEMKPMPIMPVAMAQNVPQQQNMKQKQNHHARGTPELTLTQNKNAKRRILARWHNRGDVVKENQREAA